MPPFRVFFSALLMSVMVACSRSPSGTPAQDSHAVDGGRVVGRYDGGVITEEQLRDESSKLVSPLREQFESPAGQREFVRSMIDKRLLAQEARRRGLDGTPEIQRQVQALEERLIIQALLAAEERGAPAPTETEQRAWYEGHKADFAQPERLRLGRVFAAVPPGATPAQRTQARNRVERLAKQLQAGTPLAKVAAQGDGPERAQGGELSVLARGQWRGEPAVERAAFALSKPGEVSPVVAEPGGFSVLQLLERRPARVPPYEEIRGEVETRMLPGRKRKHFEDLLTRLRQAASVEVDVQPHP
ncbi:peptidyl-prolyl cis-trans isomerase [Corallococcus sp. CA047B]|uniref:peptidylprolyl isomerase n=1 Tax=Corallococcus sp. CA047B TaxID=2316729 RepID=UPI000EA0CA73|nr:peptidylprolyl isomerase [Corallococcus sp. CA047B]RKH20048.1 peptidyl-prolyl cis-trans isomerase [Corallococcus sp. CA047B]